MGVKTRPSSPGSGSGSSPGSSCGSSPSRGSSPSLGSSSSSSPSPGPDSSSSSTPGSSSGSGSGPGPGPGPSPGSVSRSSSSPALAPARTLRRSRGSTLAAAARGRHAAGIGGAKDPEGRPGRWLAPRGEGPVAALPEGGLAGLGAPALRRRPRGGQGLAPSTFRTRQSRCTDQTMCSCTARMMRLSSCIASSGPW
ncbi:calcium-activated potassium channel subunit beta-4 isoform X2 [Canis lupus familiaris]|uniref:calcium-activated potassium channel subunit beta-4 isoform X2 n=1 Tax=Canis lupus familiaris TaxID=9615 RepID=UPI0018F39CA3|nr:calcium-activated potassium channel subunit beta-4 isoform X2 [Canis lupus familiaris]